MKSMFILELPEDSSFHLPFMSYTSTGTHSVSGSTSEMPAGVLVVTSIADASCI